MRSRCFYLLPICESVAFTLGSVELTPKFVKLELKSGKLWLKHRILDTSFAYKLVDDYLADAFSITFFLIYRGLLYEIEVKQS